MGSRKWTAEELMVLGRNISGKEIAKMTGRTLQSVYKKRSETESSQEWPIERVPHARFLTQPEKEARIYALCDKLGVRIGGHCR